jgi:HD superfamily phosphodiesterase
MNKIYQLIEKAEQSHYASLCFEVEHEFKNVWLPSHNLDHHKRVWHYAKDLLISYSEKGVSFKYEYVESLMIAVFFHDVGLTRTLNIEHGYESAQLTKRFVLNNKNISTYYLSDLIEAVELHDKKEYNDFINIGKPTLYSILTVSDDLDAFGAVGLFRYFEIYFLRKIEIEIIAKAIKENLKNRFEYVNKILAFDKYMQQLHSNRYKIAQKLLAGFSISDLNFISSLIANKTSMSEIVIGEKNISTSLNAFFQAINDEKE